MKSWKLWSIVFCLTMFFAMSIVRADEKNGPKAADGDQPRAAEYVGMDTCAMCHEKESKDFKRSAHARTFVPAKTKETQACETCHGPGSIHAEAEGVSAKRATIINPSKDPEACFKCHAEIKGQFNLQYHHPVPEGKMSCTDCHDPHGEDGIKPGARSSLYGRNAVCAKCHKDQVGPFMYEHEALREGCTTCHSIHGSINDKMLVERDANLCLKCHFQPTYSTGGLVGHVTHANRVAQGPCWSGGCHSAPHGTNYNDHSRL